MGMITGVAAECITDGIRPLVGTIGTPGVIAMGVIVFEVHEPFVVNLFIHGEMTQETLKVQ
jgi:hypothetical protein